ncbi:MAG: hypothetical protein U9Q34_00040 [Elusimicrobiota bacterium]|nr:hypothetical protein [Elusimicrobiota bacterium]
MMEDKNKDDKIKKVPPIGPFGGSMPKPPVPQGMGGSKPPLPPMGGGMPPKPKMPQMGSFPFQGAAPQAPQNSEAEKAKEEKDKLEKKILEMEKVVSQEKEKAMLATLKSQQDEVLSSKVESSLKDMQDKLRRDRHDQEVEEERLTFKAKVQELENKLVQERETWMHTLKDQMRERENQSGDVETHFIYRLQEMERRWLDEKAEWQKKLMSKDEEIIKFKGNTEKLREAQDESREVSFEKGMLEKEISKIKEEVARLERERASVETYIKIIPEKEKEIANFKAELSVIKMREEKTILEFKHREEKLLSDIERLQKDIGSVSDRKNSEKEEELKNNREKHEKLLEEKEHALASVTGEKIRTVSELVKLRGFISKVQAINAVLEKERNQMRVEKIQMAQNMAANIEESTKYKREIAELNDTHTKEMESIGKKYQSEIEKIKNEYAGEIVRDYDEKLARLQKQYHEELLTIQKKSNGDIARTGKEHQDEVARLNVQHQSEIENKALEIRSRYENNLAEMKLNIKRQFDEEFEEKIQKLKGDKTKVDTESKEIYEAKLKLEKEYKILLDDKSRLEVHLSAIKADSSNQVKKISAQARQTQNEYDKKAQKMEENYENKAHKMEEEHEKNERKMEEEYRKMNEFKSIMADEKKEYEKCIAASEIKEKNLKAKFEELSDKFNNLSALLAQKDAEIEENKVQAKETNSKLEKELKTELALESENRASFESELLFLKQKIQKMELEAEESLNQMAVEKDSFTETQNGYEEHIAGQNQAIEALNAELNAYKKMEGKFSDRMKWAFKPARKRESA